MATLTGSMTLLRDEILALRQHRQAFRAELRRGSSARQTEFRGWRSAFRGELEGARRAWVARSRKPPTAQPAATAQPVGQRLESSPPDPLSAPAGAPPSIQSAAPASLVPQAQVVPAGTVPPEKRPAVSETPLSIPPEPVHPPKPDRHGVPILASELRDLWSGLAGNARREATIRRK